MQHKADHFSRRAKKSGFPARSVYKLEEIQTKHSIIKKGDTVLDIGAAPGSWSKYAVRITGRQGKVVAVDQKPLDEGLQTIQNLVFIRCDLFSDDLEATLSAYQPFNVLMSDAAPSTSGNRVQDTATSEAIVDRIFQLAEQFLAKNGNLVAKIFQGGAEQRFLRTAGSEFKKAKLFKPKATRKKSFEIYVLGLGRK